MTAIEWTDTTWNPVRGCSRVSAGCENCYAERQAHRFSGAGQPYEGLTTMGPKGPRWTGKVRLVPEVLDQPLRWRKPRRVFVNSMSDLFHEDVPDEFIGQVFAIMMAAHWHVFQVLTKRPERMRAWFAKHSIAHFMEWLRDSDLGDLRRRRPLGAPVPKWDPTFGELRWPLPNVWLGVSCENQTTANERIPVLLDTPAAVRFVSAEPLLSALDLSRSWLRGGNTLHMGADVSGMIRNRAFDSVNHDDGTPMSRQEAEGWLRVQQMRGVKFIPVGVGCKGFSSTSGCPGHRMPALDWIIVGGESGPGARPCDVEWIRSIVAQCKACDVACFVKQLGGHVVSASTAQSDAGNLLRRKLAHRKGGDPGEWPEDLRVREFPTNQ